MTITVTPNSGYELDNLIVTDSKGNELQLTDKGNGKYTFTMSASSIKVEANFVELKPEETPWVNPYSDVEENIWYYIAVKFVSENGLMNGYGNGMFGPTDPITREQLAVMLWRYSGSPAAIDKGLNFSDADAASSYALDALRWAVTNGIINGYGDGRLVPKGLATRAQVAQMLKNYLER